jgi:mercuric ion transport protein
MEAKNRLVGIGVLSAFSASLCCITPVLALAAGTSSLATTFTWLDPLRPYLIGLTILILGLAWFQLLKPVSAEKKAEMDCTCDTPTKKPFLQTKLFLGIVSLVAALLLSFPNYAHIFFEKSQAPVAISDPTFLKVIEFEVKGMTCSGCEAPIRNEISKQSGVQLAKISYKDGNAVITYDSTRIDSESLAIIISKIGYSVTGKKEIK